MKIFLLVFLVVFSFSFFSNAQEAINGVTISESVKQRGPTGAMDELIGEYNGRVYALRNQLAAKGGARGVLIVYDKQYNVKNENIIKLPEGAKLTNILLLEGKLNVFYDMWSENRFKTLYTAPVSDEGILDSKVTELGKVDMTKSGRNSRIQSSYFEERGVYYTVTKYTSSLDIIVNLFNTEFEKIETINIPKLTKYKRVLQTYDLDENGNLHAIIKEFHVVKGQKTTCHYTLISFYNQNSSYKTYEIKATGGIDFTNLKRFNNQLIITGLSSNKTRSFYKKIDVQKKEVVIDKEYGLKGTLPKELIEHADDKDEVLRNSYSKKSFINEKGGSTWLYGSYYGREKGSAHESFTKHYLGSLFIIRYDANGNLKWTDCVLMKQTSLGGKFAGFVGGMSFQLSNGNIAILFNDHPQNSDKLVPSKLQTMAKYVLSNTVAVVLDEKGVVGKKILWVNKETGSPLHSAGSIINQSNEIVFVSPEKTKLRVCKFKLDSLIKE